MKKLIGKLKNIRKKNTKDTNKYRKVVLGKPLMTFEKVTKKKLL